MTSDKKIKVFLVEDAANIRSVLTEMLEETGQIEVIGFAETEKDALGQLRRNNWDAVVVDIGLREGNGLRVLTALNQDAQSYGKYFVYTNNCSQALKDKVIGLGADGFYDKSQDMEILVHQIYQMAN